jgi:hypothetical protein
MFWSEFFQSPSFLDEPVYPPDLVLATGMIGADNYRGKKLGKSETLQYQVPREVFENISAEFGVPIVNLNIVI